MPEPGMFVLGLTGGIGSGKTTVASMLAERGATVIDCDAIGRQVYEPGHRAHDDVMARFGTIDRPSIARVVFADPAALADLNAITHPAIDAEIADRIAALALLHPTGVVVLDMAVLVETSLGAGSYESVLVVETPLPVRLERLAQRGLSAPDARARIANQASDVERRARADWVVTNGGSLADLDAQVAALWPVLAARAASDQPAAGPDQR
jgi:dephospho-CoA kinase